MDVRRSPEKDPDLWLESAPQFSKPICAQLREWIFRWEPDLTESIKWNALCYSARRLVCGLDACKRHAALTFFRGAELRDSTGLFNHGLSNAVVRSVRITSLEEVDLRALRNLLHAAVELDVEPRLPPPKVDRPRRKAPDFFAAALRQNRAASAFFHALAPTYQQEYIHWLSSAKRAETRDQRLAQTMAALSAEKKWANRREA